MSGIILGEKMQFREPTDREKIDILMQRCDYLQSQITGVLGAVNDMSMGIQKIVMSPQQRANYVKEMFKVQLHRTAVQCQLALASGQLDVSASIRKLLDGEYKKRSKEAKCLSYYHKIMRKLERGTLIPKLEGEDEAVTP